MLNFWNALVEVVLDLKPDQAITLVVVALFLSAGTAAVFRLVSRGKTEVTTILTSLLLVSILLAMLGTMGYMRYTRPRGIRGTQAPGGPRDGLTRNPPAGTSYAIDSMARSLMEFDTDRDGRLSVEEASAAATQLINNASMSGDHPGSVDLEAIRRILRSRSMNPPLYTP
jgi:hypothetical protein